MKKILTIIYVFLAQMVIAQDYETLAHSNAPQIIASSSQSLMMRKSEFNQEVNYISDNISSVRVAKHMNNVYISWNVCDDMTYSEYFIIKSQEGKCYEVANVKNIPCSPGFPLLYSTVDRHNTNKTTFYKIFKILEDGTIKHVVTVLLPVPDESLVKNKKIKVQSQENAQKYGYTN